MRQAPAFVRIPFLSPRRPAPPDPGEAPRGAPEGGPLPPAARGPDPRAATGAGGQGAPLGLAERPGPTPRLTLHPAPDPNPETAPPGAPTPRAAGEAVQPADPGRGASAAVDPRDGSGAPDQGDDPDNDLGDDTGAPDPRDSDPPEPPAPRATLSDHLRRIRLAAADLLYPPLCTWCRAEVMEPHALCPACWRETHYIAHPLCDRCGAPISGGEDAPFCDHCLNRPLAFRRARAAVLYDGVGRDLTLAFKHGDRLDIARPASTWMRRIGRELLEDADWVAPVPLHWTRLLKRRFNQSAELARRLARDAGRPYCGDLLRRTRATRSQGGLGRDQRRDNLQGAFAVRRPDRARGARILLVDDVYTSGATLSACAEALLAAGARRVEALCLARVAPEADGPIFSRIEEKDRP
ncbi:MAG: double zinc ribbon domain-containing protein [Pseudomonadota bacterium]|nr:double zinc ribbon domain-containing protein [Pseudomonadota bacterium]